MGHGKSGSKREGYNNTILPQETGEVSNNLTSHLKQLPLWLSWSRIHLQYGRPRFSPWIGKVPWRREGLLTPVFWPGEFHGLYSPQGCKESDTTEQLSLSQDK